ncbi:FtsW/RodA/SpoVE family cell cycle protein [Candidatus Saccharibacteria bacterium]|nr:FtsW/RodA/SpoVE family cell cycle protein [Candidatus Saccharibacteria bacterium]
MRKHKPDLVIAVLTFVLMAVGLIVIYAIGPAWAQFQNSVSGSSYGESDFFQRQLISVAVAVVMFIIAYKLPFAWIEKAGKWILVLGILACVVLSIAGAYGSDLARCSLGACRWLNLPLGLSIQPVEILKLGALIYVASLIAKRKKEGKLNNKEMLVPVAVIVAVTVGLIGVLQKDLGSTAVIIFMLACMLVASGMKWRVLLMMGGIAVLIMAMLVVFFPHRMERLTSFSGEGENTYHIDNALLAIGKGGLFGVGVGNSVQATGYLPESINDSVFAVMGETFGFVGLMLVIGCFTVLLMRLLKTAERSDAEGAGRFVVVGVFAWVAGHVIINIMGMTGLIPMKGITLPFLSAGGTSMMFVAIAMGICLQLSGWTKREVNHEDIGGRRGERRTRHASSSRR